MDLDDWFDDFENCADGLVGTNPQVPDSDGIILGSPKYDDFTFND